MIAVWMAWPSWAQTVCLAVIGLAGGALANHAITTWCWFSRPSSPWANVSKWTFDTKHAPIAAGLPARSWITRVPVLGWWCLRHESVLFGSGHWIRPMVIELTLAIVLPWMHAAYVNGQCLPAIAAIPACAPWMTQMFFVHAIYVVIMVAATFIDFDERTIPDAVTVPGTLLALILATASPWMYLPGVDATGVSPVLLHSPGKLDASWMGPRGLLMGGFIWTMYCFGIADRRLILRRGIAKAVGYFMAGLTRHGTWKWLLGMWVVGLIAIAAVHRQGGLHWIGLATSLAGLAVGGGVIWATRLIGRVALQKEAMGFGDVTLMAMLGAVVGWQAAVAAFFLSPMAACVIVLVRWVITRDAATPYGPYLCAGVAITVAFWDSIYNANLRLTLLVMDDVLLWLALALGMALLAMLWMVRLIRERLFF